MTSFQSRTEEESFTSRLKENETFMISGSDKKKKYELEICEQSGGLEKCSTAAVLDCI